MKGYRAKGKSKEARDINLALNNIKVQIIKPLSTYQKYLIIRKYLAEFLKVYYKRTDIAMNELTEDFIRDYCLYLRNEVGQYSTTLKWSLPLRFD